MSLFLLLLLPLPLQLPRLSSSLSICSPFGIMMQLVTCRRGASCRHRRCCHRTGMGEGAHLRTKIEFGPRRLGAQPDVLLMRFATAQHYIHLQKVYRIYICIYIWTLIPQPNPKHTHLAAKDERQQQRHSQLRVAEEDDIQQIRISGRLQKQPVQKDKRYSHI